MTALISVDQFRKDTRAKRQPTGGVYRLSTELATPVDGAERTIRFCFSDASVDRMGDTIAVAGWDLTDFSRNPVALWAHDSSAPPIGRASNVGPEGERLMGDIEFAPAETYEFGDTIYRLVLGKFLNAVSVGFMPTEWEWSKEDDREWGIDFLSQELLEISVCPIPANGNALAEARRKGIDTRPLVEWAERALDGGGKIVVPKTELERLRQAAKESPMKLKPRRRADGANEEDPTAGGALVGTCGRAADDECGMKDPEECSVHASTKAADPVDPDDEKALLRALRKLTGKRVVLRADDGSEDEPGGDEPPMAHEDAIRMSHKCLRTAKAFLTEGMVHHAKAVDLLGDVVDALDDQPEGDGDRGQPAEDDPDGDKAARTARAAERRRRLTTV